MEPSKKSKKISIRLDHEAAAKLQEAKDKGYTASQYTNDLIKGSTIVDIGKCRQIIPPLCELESLLEHEENVEQKVSMRGELNKIWQCLK